MVCLKGKTRQGRERLSESLPGWSSPELFIIGDRTVGLITVSLVLLHIFIIVI